MPVRRRELVIIGAVAVALGVFTIVRVPPSPLNLDTLRDVIAARACLERGLCPSFGSPSSIDPFVHGAIWTRVWGGALRLHATVVQLKVAVLAMHALSAILAALLVLPFVRLRWAIVVEIVAFAIAVETTQFPLLWNPSLVPVATSLALFATVHACESRKLHVSLMFALVSGAAAAAGLSAHLGMVGMLGVLALILSTFSRRPEWTLSLYVVSAAVVLRATFRDAAMVNLHALGTRVVVAVSVAGSLAFFASVWSRSHVPLATLRRRRLALLGIALLGATGLSIPAAMRVQLADHYATPVALAGLVAFAALPTRRASRVGLAVLAVAAVNVLVRPHRLAHEDHATNPHWALADAARLQTAIAPDGFRVASEHVVGPASLELVMSMAAFAPFGRPPTPDDVDTLVLRQSTDVPRITLPSAWTTIALGSQHVALVSRRRSFLDRGTLKFCVVSLDGAETCADGGLHAETSDRDSALMTGRGYPEARELAVLLAAAGGRVRALTVSIRLRPQPDEPKHRIIATHACGDVAWSLDDGSEPRATELWVSPTSSGWLRFRAYPTREQLVRLRAWLPDYIELREDEDAIADAIRPRFACNP